LERQYLFEMAAGGRSFQIGAERRESRVQESERHSYKNRKSFYSK